MTKLLTVEPLDQPTGWRPARYLCRGAAMEHGMNDEKPKSAKEVEEELNDIKQRADELEKKIQDAETKHPPKIDHPEDGGVI